MNQTDREFAIQFGGVLGVLVVFTIAMFFLSRLLMTATMEDRTMSPQAVGERIEPVGEVYVGEVPAAQQTGGSGQAGQSSGGGAKSAQASGSGGQEVSGEKVYNNVCSACHAKGVAGAPVYGNKADWKPRIEQGKQALYEAALNGKGAMPPRGGQPSLSEEQVKAAVDYMAKAAK